MVFNFFKNKKGESDFLHERTEICSKCHKKIEGYYFHCRHCGKNFCDNHRLPEDHNCEPFQKIHEKNQEKWVRVVKDLFEPKQNYPIREKGLRYPQFKIPHINKHTPFRVNRKEKDRKAKENYSTPLEETYNPKPLFENLRQWFFRDYWYFHLTRKQTKYLESSIATLVTIIIGFTLLGVLQLIFNP